MKLKMIYELKFSKIYSFKEFIINIPPKWKGVYVWGFRFPNKYEGKFLAYYVGRRFDCIRSRISLHHDHHIPHDTHNIFKREYLPDYFKYILYKKPKSDEDFKSYENKFAYLNKDQNFKAINIPKKKISPNEYLDMQKHIDYYQQNFFACCIPVNDIEDKNERNQVIADLERHIQSMIPHRLATKKISKRFDCFKIDSSELKDENFFTEQYRERLGIKDSFV